MLLAALSALSLRQAAQESAAAAQLERCAALELGLQAALEVHTAILQSFKDDLCTCLAGHEELHEVCLGEDNHSFLRLRPRAQTELHRSYPKEAAVVQLRHLEHEETGGNGFQYQVYAEPVEELRRWGSALQAALACGAAVPVEPGSGADPEEPWPWLFATLRVRGYQSYRGWQPRLEHTRLNVGPRKSMRHDPVRHWGAIHQQAAPAGRREAGLLGAPVGVRAGCQADA